MQTAQQLRTSVYVKNVGRRAKEDDVRAAFANFGHITEIILKDGRNFAIVCFDSESAVSACLGASEIIVGDNAVVAEARNPKEKAQAPPSCNVYMNGLSPETSCDDVDAALAPFGEVTNVKVEAERGFAYACFANLQDAEAFVGASPLPRGWNVEFRRSRAGGGGGRSGGSRSRPKQEVTPQIYIKGLDANFDEAALRDAFAQFGTIVSADRRDIERDFGFVQFENFDSVEAAVNGGVVINGCELVVEARKSGTGKGRGRRNRRRRNDGEEVA